MCLIAGAEDDAAPMIGLHKNVQKKLVPWHAMIPDQGLASELRQKQQEGLIVVASLIDCLPNLGGLSRTCEVFGVSEYVVGSLKSTEDKQFRSLSVTAEQWIPISEVGRLNQVNKLKAIIKSSWAIIHVNSEQMSNISETISVPKTIIP
jgi:tRNA G18 (ribose-2'-O)-methylase SpoU